MSQMRSYSSRADMGNRLTNAFAGDVLLEWSHPCDRDRWLLVLGGRADERMGRVFDFAKRRIAGYIVFWILVLLFLGIFYRNDPPAQAGALFILVIAFIGSLLYTRRLKRKQRARRETRDAALRMQQAQAVQPPQRTPPPPRQPIEQMPGR